MATLPPHQASKALLILQERLHQAAQENRQQLSHASASHQQQLANFQEAARLKTRALQEQLVQQIRTRRRLLLLGACLRAWRSQQHAQQRHSARRALTAAVLCCWRQRARQQAAAAGRATLLRQRRTRRLLLAWCQLSMAQQQQECQSLVRADAWFCRGTLHRGYSCWRQLARRCREQRQAEVNFAARRVLQAWQATVQQHRSAQAAAQQSQHAVAARNGQRLRCAWAAWRQHAAAGPSLASKHRQQQLKHLALSTWLQLPHTNLRLRAIAAAVASAHNQLLLRWAYRAFCSCCSEAVAVRRLARECLRVWSGAAVVMSRQRQVVQARVAERRRAVLPGVVRGWLHTTMQACRQAAAVRERDLQASLACVSVQLDSRQAQLALLEQHQQQLVDTLRVAGRAGAQDHSLAPVLQWERLSDTQQHLQPRARHVAFALPVLQPTAQGRALQQPLPDVLGCVAVFGGVTAGGGWLSDVSLLALVEGSTPQQPQQQGCSLLAAPVPQLSALGPVPVCDFAACECGQAAFVVAGGFDGSTTSLTLQRCVLSQRPAASADGKPHSSSLEWAQSWCCQWEVLQPRSTQRPPLGRCHHTCSWHAASNSIVVFGGYASNRGCLDDVWVFNLQHAEWWQPERSGAWPSCRRSHAAVVMGDSLYVHGGLDSQGRFSDDLWALNLNTWTWTQLVRGGVCPTGRRAHCLVAAAQGRFLLLHGGYSGTSELLADAWVLDTKASQQCWLPVDVMPAAAADQPLVGRALHSMTSVGGRFLVVGGQHSLGPLNHVGVLASPALLLGEQQQQQFLRQQQDLWRLGKEQADLQAQHVASSHRAASAESLAARLAADLDAMRKLHDAEVAAAAARAAAAADLAATLQRRLQRAREGGCKALDAAAQLQKRS